ncbi:sensor histidine kinase [Knoellia sp. 3-2P3]|uniref:sensor histidine kinase n=1 Tax=unclassified Knoellia TaxID=2618719 RepID=UPI0023D9FE96|nr:sensor histidine kinase [Knoellia sp. 3-2P3]MDF2092679.1 sensor histidine kinase [Knoellia sp. 3-2P3]
MAGQTAALQVLVAVLVVGAGLLGAWAQAQRSGTAEATARATAVAEAVAATPDVVAAVQGPDPAQNLQPYAERVRRETRTDFVVVMSPTGRRYSHPDPAQVGRQFLGHIEQAAAGGMVVEDYTGTLGPSRRVVVPVTDDGRVVGLVAVGIRKAAVAERLRGQVPGLLLAGFAAALLSGVGTALVARRVRRQTHGLGERQLREMYEYYDAVLHAVTEGLLLVDPDGRLIQANDEAIRLLGLPADARGRPVEALGLAPPLVEALTDPQPREDELHVTESRVLVLNTAPAVREGRRLGSVATLRDRTDLEDLTGELDSAKGLAEALRSQAHESANRLHTVVSLIELGHPERALAFATEELAASQVLTDRVVASVQEPALTALLLGKAAQAGERGIDLEVGESAHWPENVAPARDLVTIVGNLVDNAFDAVAGVDGSRRVRFNAQVTDGYAVLVVEDSGPGIAPGEVERAFERGWSTKQAAGDGRRGLGLALVAQSVQRLGGDLRVEGPPGARFVVRIPLADKT